eukprot:SAG31_NODE_490_length_14932_cov_9.350300_2_plen_140_part_00
MSSSKSIGLHIFFTIVRSSAVGSRRFLLLATSNLFSLYISLSFRHWTHEHKELVFRQVLGSSGIVQTIKTHVKTYQISQYVGSAGIDYEGDYCASEMLQHDRNTSQWCNSNEAYVMDHTFQSKCPTLPAIRNRMRTPYI